MEKIYTALGLMSGTSCDGVDLSIINSNGINDYLSILDKYFEYDDKLRQKIIDLRDKITNFDQLEIYTEEIKDLEREITIFHAEVIKKTLISFKSKIDLIGFHGQTIFHDPRIKFSKQLGDGNLLSQLLKKKVVYNFRQNDLKNNGQGAPLTPIFHNVVANKIFKKFQLKFPINILNIGGITNATLTVDNEKLWKPNKIYAYDIGPGNCLIDEWIRKNSKNNYDRDGLIAGSGKIDKLILNQALDNFSSFTNYEQSLDIKDFNINFAKGLSLENGASTITEFTTKIIVDGMNYIISKSEVSDNTWLVCGGGRKNKYLLERIRKNFKKLNLVPIEKYSIDGDYIESQAFAFLAIRSLLNMPISFPSTTRCKEPLTGGIIVDNY